MKLKRLCNILIIVAGFVWLTPSPAQAHQDTTKTVVKGAAGVNESIYQGMVLKLDAGATAITVGISKGRLQHYELAMNWRLLYRLYPTFEFGYAGGTTSKGDSLAYRGHGGFFRVGMDINPLKKNSVVSPHALLIGVRLGTAVQQLTQANTLTPASYTGVQADCWGEIVAGCQVNVTKGLYMGWMGRLKCLFTRRTIKEDTEIVGIPLYIPGFGNYDNIGWGADYYIGYKF